ncbi:MAG: hypothetical protein AW07_03095 [Candidatus Accumulibacter sp. SK-11]|nr:MAG: hypothetical protein AW07_03095 [Candidatus Accumulibacter sp. SK-11]
MPHRSSAVPARQRLSRQRKVARDSRVARLRCAAEGSAVGATRMGLMVRGVPTVHEREFEWRVAPGACREFASLTTKDRVERPISIDKRPPSGATITKRYSKLGGAVKSFCNHFSGEFVPAGTIVHSRTVFRRQLPVRVAGCRCNGHSP